MQGAQETEPRGVFGNTLSGMVCSATPAFAGVNSANACPGVCRGAFLNSPIIPFRNRLLSRQSKGCGDLFADRGPYHNFYPDEPDSWRICKLFCIHNESPV